MDYNDVDEYKASQSDSGTSGNVNGSETYKELNATDIYDLVGKRVRGSLLWMVFGLLITGAVGGYVLFSGSEFSAMAVQNYRVLLFVELGVVFAFSALVQKASATTLRILFIVYAALNGVTLSILGYIYTGESVIAVFLGTLVLFSVLAIYGYVTKEDLSKYRTYLIVGLIALVVMSIINIFLRSSQMDFILSIVGVVLFVIFTAYDVNRIKNQFTHSIVYEKEVELLDKIEIAGALTLYLDFINLFLYLLRLFGRRR